MTGMMRRETWRKLIQPESKNNVGGGIKQNKKWDQRREEVKKKKEGGGGGEGKGTISGGTQRDDLALNHRRS